MDFCILDFTKKSPYTIYLDQDSFHLQSCALEGNNPFMSQWVCSLPVINRVVFTGLRKLFSTENRNYYFKIKVKGIIPEMIQTPV